MCFAVSNTASRMSGSHVLRIQCRSLHGVTRYRCPTCLGQNRLHAVSRRDIGRLNDHRARRVSYSQRIGHHATVAGICSISFERRQLQIVIERDDNRFGRVLLQLGQHRGCRRQKMGFVHVELVGQGRSHGDGSFRIVFQNGNHQAPREFAHWRTLDANRAISLAEIVTELPQPSYSTMKGLPPSWGKSLTLPSATLNPAARSSLAKSR